MGLNQSTPVAKSVDRTPSSPVPVSASSRSRSEAPIALSTTEEAELTLDELERDEFHQASSISGTGTASPTVKAASLTDRIRAMTGVNSNQSLVHSMSYNYDSPREPPHSPVDLPSVLANAASFTSNLATSLATSPDDRALAQGAMLDAILAKKAEKGAGDADPAAVAEVAAKMRSVLLPTVFHWPHGGTAVYVTGAFNNWSAKIPLTRSLNDFSLILDMPAGSYEFRYIVDDRWRYNPNETVISDSYGNVSNLLIVEPPRAALVEALKQARDRDPTGIRLHRSPSAADEQSLAEALNMRVDDQSFAIHRGDEHLFASGGDSGFPVDVEYGHHVPDFVDQYVKEPPLLPPHIGSLQQLPLNSTTRFNDPYVLSTPSSVSLHHLFCATNKKEAVRAVAVTQRYKQKTITFVMYSPNVRAASDQ